MTPDEIDDFENSIPEITREQLRILVNKKKKEPLTIMERLSIKKYNFHAYLIGVEFPCKCMRKLDDNFWEKFRKSREEYDKLLISALWKIENDEYNDMLEYAIKTGQIELKKP